MSNPISGKKAGITLFSTLLAVFVTVEAIAQEAAKETREPVYRIGRNETGATTTAATTGEASTDSAATTNNKAVGTLTNNIKNNNKNNNSAATTELAPIDRALNMANEGLALIRSDVKDYTATLIKRERINGELQKAEHMEIKIRNRKEADQVPLSIYLKFKQPTNVAGREVIYVEGQNAGKLIAHEGRGVLKGVTAKLNPDGMMAMKGNRYPIYEAGIENLVFRLIEKGNRDKELGDSEVRFATAKINGRKCTVIQVSHPNRRPEHEFYMCRVFIDQELNVPIRYAAYGWPEVQGGKPVLDEEYTYLDLNLNVGLTDADFDSSNNAYSYR